ncbi:MAG TPA: hypothetical protein VEH77_19820, partial [Roseiarcus sp.]|nr:hypothetical protein [Roseiarcus sp.]
LAPTGGAIGPADTSAEVTLRGKRWTFSRILATVAGIKASGGLVYEPPPEAAGTAAAVDLERAEEAASGLASPPAPAGLTGELTLDRLRLADLAALALGRPTPPVAGKIWPDSKFGAPPIAPPAAAVRFNVATLSLSDALAAQGFSTNLRFDKGRLDLEDMAMRLADGAVSGRATLRRSGDTATLDGAATVEPALIKRPGFSGRVGGRLEFASTGKSVADLVAGLAGGGTADFSGAALARSDPSALETVVAAAQGADAKIDETNVAFALASALDNGPLAIPNGSTPIAMSAGKMKLGPLAIARQSGEAALTASLDLPRMTLETRLQLIGSAKGLKFWSGPPPAATVTVANALDQPKRRIDAAGLAAGLATQAIARESDRIATLEADIRERAFFNRRLKGERFLDRRNAEIEDWRAEQDRLKGIAERLSEQREEERVAAERAAAERAAAEKVAAERAAAEKAAAERADAPPQPEGAPAADGAAGRPPPNADALGAEAPIPPARPKPKPAPLATDPSASGIY